MEALRLLVDGDASGHQSFLLEAARRAAVPLVWAHNPSQRAPSPPEGLEFRDLLSDAGDQAADVALMNLAGPGDIVVTGDLGLAMVCLAKGAAAISPRGFWFRAEELAVRAEFRALHERLRRAGGRAGNVPPRRRLDDWRFEVELSAALGL